MIRASAMTVELPSATLTNFIWFLVVLNIFLFLYINSHAKGMSVCPHPSSFTRGRADTKLYSQTPRWSGGSLAILATGAEASVSYLARRRPLTWDTM